MSSTGNVFPGTGANDASIGATAWTSPGNITATDANDATCNAGASSQYLVAKNFGFAIPSGSAILGITVRVNASESSAGSETLNARLQDAAGALTGTGKTASLNGTSKTVYTYGSTADVWGASLTDTVVNDVDFGVRLWFTTSHNVAIDYVTLAVEYTAGTQALNAASTTITSARGTATPVPLLPLVGTAATAAQQSLPSLASTTPLVGSAITSAQGDIVRGRGQQIQSGQGSVGTAQPLVGSASTVGQGTIAPDANPPVEEDVFGEESAFSQGASTQTTLVRLNSRKVGAPSSATWALSGAASFSATGLFTPTSSRDLTGHLITGGQGQHGKQRVAALLGSSVTTSAGTLFGPVSATFTTLFVQGTSIGTFPYSATLYPIQGDVPSGRTIRSDDDPTLRASILSTHADGSASVVVMAGRISFVSTNQLRNVTLYQATATDTPLTTAAITAQVSNVSVAFGSPYGTASISSFTSPERTWWANGETICCRYRVAAPTPGSTQLEAVIDIHAYNGRALVEVVVENCKMVSSTPVKPTAATYTNAVASVNGVTIATVSSPAASGGMYNGTHEAFRAWYASGWVGGDPAIEVTHDRLYIQRHPLLFQCDQLSNQDMQALYASAAYTPWSKAGLNVPNMPAFGDSEQIGALTRVDTRYVQTGSRYTRRAVLANALAVLGCNVSYRDTASGAIPTFTQTTGKTRNFGEWPETTTEPAWETPHSPDEGLLAFMCRPSPCFIEIAQKVAVWNLIYQRPDATVNVHFATRGIAWAIRSLGHAIFLTPDGDAWKSPAKSCMDRNVTRVNQYKIDPANTLGVVYAGGFDYSTPGVYGYIDERSAASGFQASIWMTFWLGNELHKIAQTGSLTSNQTALDTVADWACALPVRMVNESTGGEWRYHQNEWTIGSTNITSANGFLYGSDGVDAIYASDTTTPGMGANWGAQFAATRGAAPAFSGTWMVSGVSHPGPVTNYTNTGDQNTGYSVTVNNSSTVADYNYVEHFWQGLCYAVERGVSGSAAAWATVNANVTNLATWRGMFANEPRGGIYPRNVASMPAWRTSMAPLTWKQVGSTMHSTADAMMIGALNPLGAGVSGTWDTSTTSSYEGFSAIMNGWSGGAYRADNARLYVFGGGHVAYAGNEVVSVDLFAESPAWRIERPPTGWKSSPSEGILLDDGLETSKVYSNGDPRSAHTYDLLAWANGALYAIPSAVWKTSAEGTTAYKLFKFTPGANPTVGSNASYGTWSVVNSSLTAVNTNSSSLTYDPVRNYLYICHQSSMQRFNITGNALLSAGSVVATDGELRGVYIPSLDVVVYLNYFPTGRFWVYNPSTNTAHSPGAVGGNTNAPNPVAEPTKSNTSVVSEYFTAAVWVPGLGAIMARIEGGTGFHLLTPPSSGSVLTTAWTWSRLEASASNTVTPDHRNLNGDYGRFFYSPELRCVGFVSATSAAQAGNPNSTGKLNIFALP